MPFVTPSTFATNASIAEMHLTLAFFVSPSKRSSRDFDALIKESRIVSISLALLSALTKLASSECIESLLSSSTAREHFDGELILLSLSVATMSSNMISSIKKEGKAFTINILVAGASGLGKTSVIKSIFNLEGHSFNEKGQRVDSRGVVMKSPLPEKNSSQLKGEKDGTISLATRGFVITQYRNTLDNDDTLSGVVVDSPGYANGMNVVESINDLLYFAENWKPGGNKDVYVSPKNRMLHVCLFFLTPQRIRHIDLRALELMAKILPIVLICSRADSYELEEKRSYSNSLLSSLSRRKLIASRSPGNVTNASDHIYRDIDGDAGFFVIDKKRTAVNGNISCPSDECFDNEKLAKFLADSLVARPKGYTMGIRAAALKKRENIETRGIAVRSVIFLDRQVMDKPMGMAVVAFLASLIVMALVRYVIFA